MKLRFISSNLTVDGNGTLIIDGVLVRWKDLRIQGTIPPGEKKFRSLQIDMEFDYPKCSPNENKDASD